MTTIPESHRDLLEAQVATFGTVDDDGFPQLTETWFLYEGDEVKLSLNSGRRKTRNLERRPQCSLLILDLQNPYRYLEMRGRAAIEPDDGSFVAKVGEKYGTDVTSYDEPGETRVVVTLDRLKVHAVDMSG